MPRRVFVVLMAIIGMAHGSSYSDLEEDESTSGSPHEVSPNISSNDSPGLLERLSRWRTTERQYIRTNHRPRSSDYRPVLVLHSDPLLEELEEKRAREREQKNRLEGEDPFMAIANRSPVHRSQSSQSSPSQTNKNPKTPWQIYQDIDTLSVKLEKIMAIPQTNATGDKTDVPSPSQKAQEIIKTHEDIADNYYKLTTIDEKIDWDAYLKSVFHYIQAMKIAHRHNLKTTLNHGPRCMELINKIEKMEIFKKSTVNKKMIDQYKKEIGEYTF